MTRRLPLNTVSQPRRIEVSYEARPGDRLHVGSLALQRGRPVFEFAASWRVTPKPIAPFTVQPKQGLLVGPDRMQDRLHGVFADSLPDAWGRVVADRHFAKLGLARERITVLDRLALVGASGMGALTYLPAIEDHEAPFVPDLDQLHDEAQRVIMGSAGDALPQLIAAAGSSGGARPKILAGIDEAGMLLTAVDPLPAGYTPYLIKLGTHLGDLDDGAVEFAYRQMAEAAGITVPVARLLETERTQYFATARFDRIGTDRVHMATLSGLLDIPHDYFAMEYGEIGRVIARVSASYTEAQEFARRMVFNVLAYNRDDHLKNTALLMSDDGTWRLSPAYDLTFMPGPGGEHSMLVAGEGKSPGLQHLLRAAETMGVESAPMRTIVDQVASAVGNWHTFADQAKVSARRRNEIDAALRRIRQEVLGRTSLV